MRYFLSPCLAAFLLAAVPPRVGAAVKPGLEGAQDLFRRNHWEEARAHLRSQWASLPDKDRGAATFLMGRSYVREAELYAGVRRIGAETGLIYMEELASARVNRTVAWIPLFTGLYQLEAGRYREAERTLLAASASVALPAEWKATARLRRAVALHRLGRAQEAATILKEPSPESRFCRLLTGTAEAAPGTPRGRRERLIAAAVLFRVGRGTEAEALLAGQDLDAPDVEERPDPKKVFRFHDPAVSAAWERICWERAVAALTPLATGGAGTERSLAAYYVGLSLFHLGALGESAKFLREGTASSLGAELQPGARLLISACSWEGRLPTAQELASLWDDTQGQPESVFFWQELSRVDLAKTEPFATKLGARLAGLLPSSTDRPSGALVGRWGLARLWRGDDPAALLAALSQHRDNSNKNKLEWNDPLLLLALSAANARDQEYPQALETLFELSKTLPGLRALQWNLQGIYAARQKAGGEARINQT